MSNRKIGIIFGAFDPIHEGHLQAARSAKDTIKLDEVVFMVEEETWSGKKLAPISHRFRMVKLAIEDEFHLLKQTDPKFSIIKTLPKLEKKFKNCELFFIMGADVFININKNSWPNLEKILKHYFVVFERAGIDCLAIEMHSKKIGAKTAIFTSLLPNHSSTEVKKNLNKKDFWLPKKVENYIDKHSLYL